MIVITSPSTMQAFSKVNRARKKRIGFVATMGALHAGHISLIRKARLENDCVVVSIFVNPTQFGPLEDFKKYPRTVRQDMRLCRKAGLDVVFRPSAATMYPEGFSTMLRLGKLEDTLCGSTRPGHFSGGLS